LNQSGLVRYILAIYYTMQKIILSSLFLFVLLTNWSQNITDNKQYGLTYNIYKLDSTQARVLYQQQKVTDTVDLFTNLYKTIYTDSTFNKNKLPNGHYLITKAKGTNVEYESFESQYFQIRSNGYNGEAWFFIADYKGEILEDATLQVKGKTYTYRADCNCYPIPKVKGNGWAKIVHNNQFTYVMIDGYKAPNEKFKNKKTKYKNNTFSAVRVLPGYIAFNQPKYHLEDTVKLKAFLVKENGKPWRRKVKLQVYDPFKYKNAFTKVLSPLTDGAYVYEFAIPDTFDIDQNYNVFFRTKRNKLLKKSKFRVEDYKLGNTTYFAKLEQSVFHQGENLVLLLEGKDANGLPLLDGYATINIKLDQFVHHYRDTLFVPEKWKTSIYKTKILLDVSGETRLEIPDSIFPLSKTKYEVSVILNNSENEPKKFNFIANYDGATEYYTLKLKGDSIKAEYLYLGKSSSACKAKLVSLYKGIILEEKMISLPFSEKINYAATRYYLRDETTNAVLGDVSPPSKIHQLVYPIGKRTHDSIHISFHNEIEIPISWQLYKSDKKIKGGKSSTLDFAVQDETLDSYYIIYAFRWQDRDIVREKAFHIKEKKLTVSIDQPEIVFPGASVPITVTVTDYKKEAKKDVNLTAWSVNTKFGNIPSPDLPYFGLKHFEILRPFDVSHGELHTTDVKPICTKDIARLNLYNTPFYRLIYSVGGVGIEYDSINSEWAEFSPYLYTGKLNKIYTVYINNKPVFIDATQQSTPLSIKHKPGTYDLKIRTDKELYTIKNIELKPSQKAFICLNADSSLLNDNVEYLKLDSLPYTMAEIEYLKSHFLVSKIEMYSDIYLEQDSIIIKAGRNYGNTYYDQDYGRFNYYGPFKKGKINVTDVANDTSYSFYFEPGYLYTFQKDSNFVNQPIVYPSPIGGHYRISANSNWKFHMRSYQIPKVQQPKKELTQIVYSRVEEERKRKKQRHPLLKTRNHIDEVEMKNVAVQLNYQRTKAPIWIGFFNSESDLSTHIQFGSPYFINGINSGKYDIFVHFKDSSYALLKNYELLSNGKNYIRFDPSYVKIYDSLVLSTYEQKVIKLNKPAARKFNNPPTEIKGFSVNVYGSKNNTTMLSGYLRNHLGEPIDYATIYGEIAGYFKGGAVTNSEGYFEMKDIPAGKYMLKIMMQSHDNYTIYNINVPSKKNTEVTIKPQILFKYQDNITFYGSDILNDVYVENSFSSETNTSNVSLSSVLVASNANGVFSLSRRDISKMPGRTDVTIASLEATLQTIPGVISSKKKQGAFGKILGDYETGEFKKIRTTFRDYGFWQPNLVTNKNGQAHFTVQYPDNITQWKTIVPAMDGHKNSGIGYAYTKSFKPLSANLGMPRFLIANDTAQIIGKVLNYTDETVAVKTYFNVNGVEHKSNQQNPEHYSIDKFAYSSDTTGSMKITFGLDKGDGYEDGEERKIEIFTKGVKTSSTELINVKNDTTITILPSEDISSRTLFITNDPFDVIKRELQELKAYHYGCNEQTASKIKALLLEKKLLTNLNQPFEDEKLLRKYIKTLEKNQNDNGSWGWWDKSTGDNWITGYVTETMNLAVAAGYRTRTHMKGASYLKTQLKSMNISSKLEALNALASIPYPMDYGSEITKIKPLNLSLQDEFQYIKLKQSQDSTIDIKKIIDSYEKGKEGIYWGEQLFNIKVNQLQTSMLAYDILKKEEGNEELLKQIRSYFLNYKSNTRNTIEQASMLQRFLADMLVESNLQQALQPEIKINNSVATSDYPLEFNFSNTDTITFSKRGAPVKLYSTSHKIELAPTCSDSLFKISTKFVTDNKEVTQLKAGTPITMEVEVIVRKSSKYVLIEIPIPASCVYGGALQIKNSQEEYRKQYKNKTAIACRNLSAGRHKFTIQLIPRFEGSYAVLPARVQLMYYPEVSNYTETKRVVVK